MQLQTAIIPLINLPTIFVLPHQLISKMSVIDLAPPFGLDNKIKMDFKGPMDGFEFQLIAISYLSATNNGHMQFPVRTSME